MRTVLIRKAKLTDVPLVCGVFEQCFGRQYVSHTEIWEGRADSNGNPLPEAATLLLQEMPTKMQQSDGNVWVADIAGEIVGFAIVQMFTGRRMRYGVLNDVCVIRAFRRTGVGALLVKSAFASLAQRGVEMVFAESGVENTSAHGFLDRMGFTTMSHVFVSRVELQAGNKGESHGSGGSS